MLQDFEFLSMSFGKASSLRPCWSDHSHVASTGLCGAKSRGRADTGPSVSQRTCDVNCMAIKLIVLMSTAECNLLYCAVGRVGRSCRYLVVGSTVCSEMCRV